MHLGADFSKTGECCQVKVWYDPSFEERVKMLQVMGLEGPDAARRYHGYLSKTRFIENEVGEYQELFLSIPYLHI